MGYSIDQEIFDHTFIQSNGTFKHKTNLKYNLFPYNTKDQADKILPDFDGILGAFFQNIYSVEAPSDISREKIIEEICNDVSFNDNVTDRQRFAEILRKLYFKDGQHLRCDSLSTFKYTDATSIQSKISEYIVSTMCDKERILSALSAQKESTSTVMDKLVEAHLPKLSEKKKNTEYAAFFPQIKELFTRDIIVLIENNSTEFADFVQLISYYYFFRTSQVILQLNQFCEPVEDITPFYFILSWEKTSKNRKCFEYSWRKLECLIETMFPHAALLEMLNQTGLEKKYSYKDLLDEYNASNDEQQSKIFNCLENLKKTYREKYVPESAFEDNLKYAPAGYADRDLAGLISEFHSDILFQFRNRSNGKRLNGAYQKGFHQFCKENFVQNRRRNGLVLALSEEQLVLFTKIIIGKKPKMPLKELFEEFSKRGIGMDMQTRECVAEFYEKLNIIEKKSDSGDAQYVKRIL